MAKKKAKKVVKTTSTKISTITKIVDRPNKIKNILNKRTKINDIDKIFSEKTISMLFVEMIGVMLLAIIFTSTRGNPLYMLLASLAVFVALGNYSKTFFNPLISFGAWVTNKISAKKMVLTMIAQFLGGMLALVLLQTFFNQLGDGAQATALKQQLALFKISELPEKQEWFVFLGELIGSTVFAFFVAQSWRKTNNEQAVSAAGGYYISLLLGFSLMTFFQAQAVFNPALLPTLNNPEIKTFWEWIIPIYVLAPLIGGAIGFIIDAFIVKPAKTTIITK